MLSDVFARKIGIRYLLNFTYNFECKNNLNSFK